MKLAFSNIAWSAGDDAQVYAALREHGFSAVEIAPTRIFPNSPYEHLSEASAWKNSLRDKFGLSVASMQSVWFGRNEKVFGGNAERIVLIDYTKRAIDFAIAVGCKNLVFGSPKNRDTDNLERDLPVAIEFFREIGNYAAARGVVVALEPNPTIYGTRFLNRTEDAVAFAKLIGSAGIRVNFDLGTLIQNEESLDVLKSSIDYISHVHISEPGLKIIKARALHRELCTVLKDCGYSGFVSVEMANPMAVENVFRVMEYAVSVFGNRLSPKR